MSFMLCSACRWHHTIAQRPSNEGSSCRWSWKARSSWLDISWPFTPLLLLQLGTSWWWLFLLMKLEMDLFQRYVEDDDWWTSFQLHFQDEERTLSVALFVVYQMAPIERLAHQTSPQLRIGQFLFFLPLWVSASLKENVRVGFWFVKSDCRSYYQ